MSRLDRFLSMIFPNKAAKPAEFSHAVRQDPNTRQPMPSGRDIVKRGVNIAETLPKARTEYKRGNVGEAAFILLSAMESDFLPAAQNVQAFQLIDQCLVDLARQGNFDALLEIKKRANVQKEKFGIPVRRASVNEEEPGPSR